MANFNDVCKNVYAIFLRSGYLGIDVAGETDSAWIISPAQEDPSIVEYDPAIFIIDKRSGRIRYFDFFDSSDRAIYNSAKAVSVPKEYLHS